MPTNSDLIFMTQDHAVLAHTSPCNHFGPSQTLIQRETRTDWSMEISCWQGTFVCRGAVSVLPVWLALGRLWRDISDLDEYKGYASEIAWQGIV